MYFAKERAELICRQLKDAIITKQIKISNWDVKEGCYVDVSEAEASKEEWKKFDAETDRWYGKDRHYWFRSFITVPDELDGCNMWLHIRTQLEDWDDGRNPQFLVFINKVPTQGLDINHLEIKLTNSAKAGEKIQVDLQAYTGTLHSEFKLLTDLEERDEEIKDLYYDIQVPLWGLDRMDKDDRIRIMLESVINETINLIDLRKIHSNLFYESIRKASDYIRINLYENNETAGFDDVIATCIGHTHIDVAWLWTVAQVRQKSCRSFATVLKLMEEYPGYKFMSSQPQLYEFVKERHPELYQRIKDRVSEGRWEPEGGMWVEADCNLTSGESLVRQFLVGKTFFKNEFGKDNEILWLPDAFGYSAALPQIMKKSGVNYFMTTKLAWNEFNKIPNDTFMWEGIDGTSVFTYLITTLGVGQAETSFFTTYNGMLHPDAIIGGWHRYQNKEINNDILISYGYGDGGGGPTRQMLETSKRMEKGIIGIPKVRQEFSKTFFDELYDKVKDNKRLPKWVGELYFEYHRGTLTSMGRNKKKNRKCEYRMMELELLSVLAEKTLPYPQKELDDMWKIILRNQFHDILPGSAIREVYEVTDKEYTKIEHESVELLNKRFDVITPDGNGICVFNTLGFDRSDIVNLGDINFDAVTNGSEIFPVQETADGAISFIKGIPSKGYLCLEKTENPQKENPFEISDGKIKTPFYDIKIDKIGQFTSIYDLEAQREILKEGEVGNELRVYEDKPLCFDNWNIDIFYQEKSWPVDEDAKLEWTEKGPVRASLKVTKKFLDCEFVQYIRFYADDRRIDFETTIDWKLSQHLCKVHFPLDIHTDEAVFDIQFGNVTRKIHQNTSWDVAKFETCGHKWADMSENGYGVSLLNDCKYGYSAIDKKLSLTLLKAGTEPNETADIEVHHMTYSLYPHMGGFREGGTVNESFNLNVPAHTFKGGYAGDRKSFISIDKGNVVLETVKKSEDGTGVIVRLYEVFNERSRVVASLGNAFKSVTEVNLMENDEKNSSIISSDNNSFTFLIKPYEIKTFKIVF